MMRFLKIISMKKLKNEIQKYSVYDVQKYGIIVSFSKNIFVGKLTLKKC